MTTHLCSVCVGRFRNCGEILEDVAPCPALVNHIIHHVSRHHNLLLHHVSKCQRGTIRIPATHLCLSGKAAASGDAEERRLCRKWLMRTYCSVS